MDVRGVEDLEKVEVKISKQVDHHGVRQKSGIEFKIYKKSEPRLSVCVKSTVARQHDRN